MSTMRKLAEQLKAASDDVAGIGTIRLLGESMTNPNEPYATSIRNAWSGLSVWADDIGKRLTKSIGDGVKIVGSIGVAKGVGDAVEVVLSFHMLGTLDEEDVFDMALVRLQNLTNSTWVKAKRNRKFALVATYDF